MVHSFLLQLCIAAIAFVVNVAVAATTGLHHLDVYLNCTAAEGRSGNYMVPGRLVGYSSKLASAAVNFTFVLELKKDQQGNCGSPDKIAAAPNSAISINTATINSGSVMSGFVILSIVPLDVNYSSCDVRSIISSSVDSNLMEFSGLSLLVVLPNISASHEHPKFLLSSEPDIAVYKDRFAIVYVNSTAVVGTASTCSLSVRQKHGGAGSNQDDATSNPNNENMLTNFSRTSVLFVSISFIILMVISLAWLLFYYVQRFRYAHAKDRLARRLFNAAKKALTKIPAKALRQGDRELDSDCPVCIEPYRLNDIIRILPCKHLFHKSCVDPWLLEHRTCPMCKMDILKAFGYQFCHNNSQDSVHQIDGDQLSGATSTDGRNSFPLPLSVESDLHDPFFPSPAPSPSLVQPVMHQSNAQGYAIIPLTVHGVSLSSRLSESSESSNGSGGELSESYGAGGSARPLFHGTSAAEVHRMLTTSSSCSTDAAFSSQSTNSSPEKPSSVRGSGLVGQVQRLALLRPTRSMIVHSPKAVVTIVESSSDHLASGLFPVPVASDYLAGRGHKIQSISSATATSATQTKRSFSLPSEANVPCSNE